MSPPELENTLTNPITIAVAGPGDSNFDNTADLLNDWLGYGEADAEGYFEESEREVTLILPITSETIANDGFLTVLDWSEKADLPYIAVTDDSTGRKIERLLKEADAVHKVANVEAKIISLLKDATGEAVFVALWGEEGDELTERILSLADEAGIPAKDLTDGLDVLTFADDSADEPVEEPEPEADPEPEPEEAPRRRGRRGRAAESEEAVEEEQPLTEDDTKVEEPVVEEKPKRTRRTKAQIAADNEAAEAAKAAAEPEPEVDAQAVAEESIKAAAKEAADTLREQEAKREVAKVEPTANPWSKPYAPADLENRFAFHAATTEEKRNAHTSVRVACLNLAKFIDESLPDGREKSSAITKVEEAMFWANAGLARQNTAQAEAVSAPESASEEAGGTETQEEPPRRGRGRPRKDGSPAQPRTEDDLKVAFLEDEDGKLRRRGRGRPRTGEKVVELTPSEIQDAIDEGLLAA